MGHGVGAADMVLTPPTRTHARTPAHRELEHATMATRVTGLERALAAASAAAADEGAGALVREQQDVILGRCRSGTCVTHFLCSIVDWQYRYGRNLWVRRKKGPNMQHRAQRDISEIRRCAVIADNTVGEHSKRGWADEPKFSFRLYTDAAAAIGMIHEH